MFAYLCKEEFKIQPDIIITKRLRRAEPTKIRPLLIVTRKAEQAHAASDIDGETTPQVIEFNCSRQVFINRNLTKAEAEAAYCVRVQRRQMTVQHADHTTSSNTDNEKSREMECEREVAGSDLLYHQSAELITRIQHQLHQEAGRWTLRAGLLKGGLLNNRLTNICVIKQTN